MRGIAAGVLFCSAFIAGMAQAGQCIMQQENIKGYPEQPKIPTYQCSISDTGTAGKLSIKFFRLNEALAGNLIMDEAVPEAAAIYQKSDVLKNKVIDTARSLFDRFARYTAIRGNSLELNVQSPKTDGKLSDKVNLLKGAGGDNNDSSSQRLIWTLLRPFDGSYYNSSVIVKEAHEAIANSNSWPLNYFQTYLCQGDALRCTLVWRYAKLDDLNTIKRDTDILSTEIETGKLISQASAQDGLLDNTTEEADDKTWAGKGEPYECLKYLGSNGWPEQFLTLSGTIGGTNGICRTVFEYSLGVPLVSLDIAIVENNSDAVLDVKDIRGVLDKSVNLRAPLVRRGDAEIVQALRIRLQPKAKLVIPLRLVFTAHADWANPTAKSEGNKMFRKISRAPDDAVFRLGVQFGENVRYVITKRKDTFQAPHWPTVKDYVFGPEIVLTGLTIQRSKASLPQATPNTLELRTAPYEASYGEEEGDELNAYSTSSRLQLHQNVSVGGSCPVLYFWNKRTGVWVDRGKVIHEGDTAAAEMTTAIAVDPDARRFRLAEREPEISYIRRVNLRLHLRDGRQFEIAPESLPGGGVDGFQYVIPAFTKRDFRFAVPREYEAIGIERAEIAVTGYYLRYSSLLMAQSVSGPTGAPR